jgi:hypothetical protein
LLEHATRLVFIVDNQNTRHNQCSPVDYSNGVRTGGLALKV